MEELAWFADQLRSSADEVRWALAQIPTERHGRCPPAPHYLGGLVVPSMCQTYQHTLDHDDTLLRMGLWWDDAEHDIATRRVAQAAQAEATS